MNQPSARSSNSLPGAYVFRIYIADGAPNSVRALANLYAICHQHFPESHRIEVVDILKEPLRALAESILVTPTVVKLSPAPEQRIIGNLSEEEAVLCVLGLPEKANG
jgi:circadian clock protein KaiB